MMTNFYLLPVGGGTLLLPVLLLFFLLLLNGCSCASNSPPHENNWERHLFQSTDDSSFNGAAAFNQQTVEGYNGYRGIGGESYHWNDEQQHFTAYPSNPVESQENPYYYGLDATYNGNNNLDQSYKQQEQHSYSQHYIQQQQQPHHQQQYHQHTEASGSENPRRQKGGQGGRSRRQMRQEDSNATPSSSTSSSTSRASIVDQILSRPALPLPPISSQEEEGEQGSRSEAGTVLSYREVAEVYRQGIQNLNVRTGGAWTRQDANDGGVSLSTGPRKAGRALNLPKLSPMEIKRMLDEKWKEKRIAWDLKPREIAKRVALIKLETGYDMQIGVAASKRVKKVMEEEFLQLYRIFQRRYTRRISFLRGLYEKDSRLTTDLARARAVYNNKFRTLRPRKYNAVFTPRDKFALWEHQAAMERAKDAWSYFMTYVVRRMINPTTRSKDLSIDQIEFLSRDLEAPGTTKTATTQYLQLYMGQVMKKDDDEMERFGTLRAIYREATHTVSRTTRRRATGIKPRWGRGRGGGAGGAGGGRGNQDGRRREREEDEEQEEEELEEDEFDDEGGEGDLIDDGDDEEYGDEEESGQ